MATEPAFASSVSDVLKKCDSIKKMEKHHRMQTNKFGIEVTYSVWDTFETSDG
jgi:hypothetical protein